VSVGTLFFGILCWDITADRRGLWNSVWVPICALSVPLLLRLFTYVIRERVVFQEELELETRMTLKVGRLQRHSVTGSSDFSGMNSIDEAVRFRRGLVGLEEVRKTSARDRTASSNTALGVEMIEEEDEE
jgi:hypothetical protein